MNEAERFESYRAMDEAYEHGKRDEHARAVEIIKALLNTNSENTWDNAAAAARAYVSEEA